MSAERNNTYIVLSLQQRLEILRKLEYGVPVSQLMTDYGVSVATIRRIKRNSAQLQQTSATSGQIRKRMRKPVLHDLDDRLYAWYLQQREIGERITDAQFHKKALKLNEQFAGPSTFTANRGWIWRFKRRHGIAATKTPTVTEDTDVPTKEQEEFIQGFLWRLNEENIQIEHIYSMDETNLMWKTLPPRVLAHTGEKNILNNVQTDCVTVGLCTNVTGSHKLPPLFVHKYEKPRALKHLNQDCLPVVYKTQENASIDKDVYDDWLENHFKPAVRRHQLENGRHGKVLLLVDTDDAHMLAKPLEVKMEEDNIKVVFLPADAKSTLNPMGQGIVEMVKKTFRHRVLQKVLGLPYGVTQFYSDYDIKDCIDTVNEVWQDVSRVVIRDSWQKLLGNRAKEEILVKEEERDADASSITGIRETVGAIVGTTISQQEIENWLSTCEKTEDDPNTKCEKKCPLVQKTPSCLDEEEVDRTFSNLLLWSLNQPEFVKLQIQVLKKYYEEMHKQSDHNILE
ncbi:PREDICTED: tigger transposable element-derived protein 2-like [Dufourea novaeangliae]|uniref:tigger transposable element-derived protein 2-like n=1 Tax=Dufourea novaeangliae TaxID=178035 RepID=UPI000766FEBF|nr:PREDICTED: tigger transposable element-derived protein 2-like [Dufourea novaeangliae]